MDRRIGAQFYTLRDHTRTIEDFELTCKKVSEIGYKIVQISGTPLKAAEMKPILDHYGLQVVTTHRGFDDFRENLDDVIAYNRILGSELCGLGCLPECYRTDEEALKRFLEELESIVKTLKKEGLLFGYHNHDLEFVRLGGKQIMDWLVEETDPETVQFIVDTFWVKVGGLDPAAFIRRLGGRAMAVHFKDLKVSPDNPQEMAEIGEGKLDWDEIIRACDEAGAKWALVEQDICRRDPFESMKMSYDYLKGKGFE